eukprot:m.42772 g.42772  ORF g.42772 m.42772 type:complete len:97 (+) comp33386_c0_seq1:3261-3551(+)
MLIQLLPTGRNTWLSLEKRKRTRRSCNVRPRLKFIGKQFKPKLKLKQKKRDKELESNHKSVLYSLNTIKRGLHQLLVTIHKVAELHRPVHFLRFSH